MPRTVLLLLALAGPLPGAAPAAAQERLVVLGGGPRSHEALARFVTWAGGNRARILVVAWASPDPASAYASLRADLGSYGPEAVWPAPAAPVSAQDRLRLGETLARATGVFFTGGDQRRLMDVVEEAGLGTAFRQSYERGTVFAGTSAGTAVMSGLAITGERDATRMEAAAVSVRRGLGLLPGVILDQHFIRRQRQNRLFGLVLEHPDLLGVGVDEGTALAVQDNRHAEVLGKSRVLVVDGQVTGELLVHVLEPGDTFDLRARRRAEGLAHAPPAGALGRP